MLIPRVYMRAVVRLLAVGISKFPSKIIIFSSSHNGGMLFELCLLANM